MMLEARELGIDSCIIGALQNEATVIKNPELVQKVNEKLGLTSDDLIITIITLGYAKEETPTVKQRKDFNKIVYFEKIDNSFN
jgi:nitroreductase